MKKIRIRVSKETEYHHYSKFVPFQGNLKDLTKENYLKLRESIVQFGVVDKMKAWRHPNGDLKTMDGHQRVLTIKRMVEEEGYECPDLPINLVEADNEEEARLILLALAGQYGTTNREGLHEYLVVNNIELPKFESFGHFNDIDPKSFSLEFYDDNKVDPSNDVGAGEPPKEPKSKIGDIWSMGRHKLVCGDATLIDDVEKLMSGEKADLVFTDPPYGIAYQSNGRKKSKKFDILKNDDTFLTEWVQVLPTVSSGWVFVWTAWKVVDKWIEICRPIGDLSNVVIWSKGGGGLGDLEGAFATDFELALVYNRGAKLKGKRIGSVWSVGKDAASQYQHPTQKPVDLALLAIESCTVENQIVLDLFAGSGSTLMAAENSGRIARIMELSPQYCDVILDRWARSTQQDPVRDDGILWSKITA